MMNRHAIPLFLIVSSALLAMNLNARQELSYETLGDLRMKSLGLSMASENKCEDIKDAKQALHISIPGDEKHRMVYKLYAQSEKRRGIDAASDDEALKTLFTDLDVLGDLFSKVDGNVQTFMGEAAAAKMLGAPLACDTEQSAQQLEGRKALIQKLANDPKLLAQCDQLIQQIKGNQDNLLSYWAPEAPLTKELIGKLYFGKVTPAQFNTNSMMLEAGVRLGNVWTGFCLCGDVLLLSLLNYGLAALAHKSNPVIPAPTIKDTLVAGVKFYNPYNAIKQLWNLDSPESVAACRQAAENAKMTPEAMRRMQSISLKVSAGLQSAMLGYKAIVCKRAIDNAIQVRDTANYLQERLIGVASYVRGVRQLINLSLQYPEFARGITTLPEGVALFERKGELRELNRLLLTDTFSGHSSFFSMTGRVLAAHTLMQSVKDELFDCFACLGELDACVSIAHLYKQHEHDRAACCFAEICTQTEPYICAVDFWNPMVRSTLAVTNSVELGHPCAAHHMILTGSNKGGKSTLLKAMMINTLLMQTWTVAFAKRFIATPFNCLRTYLNVTDNTVAGQSLFAAQVARAKKIVQSVDSLKSGNRAFIVIDEIFTGTGSGNASKAAAKVVNHLAASPNACFIIATHFVDTLPLLEKSTNGCCKNFKFDADKDEQGNLEFRYKLEEGISTTNIANEILGQELNEIDFSSELGDL